MSDNLSRRAPFALFMSVSMLALGAAGSATAQEVTQLQRIAVEGGLLDETGWGPADDFLPESSLTATKTDTPLIETPQSISVVTSEQIEEQGARSIGATLRYTSGVRAESTGAADTRYGGFTIRGFDATSTSFFRDGLRQPSSSFTNVFNLDPYGAERIEVLKGPSSTLYGSTGPGGLINYVSKRPTEERINEVSMVGGDFDRLGTQFDFSGPVGEDGTWLYRFTGLARNAGSEVDFVDDDRIFFAPALTWQPDDATSLTLLANVQRDRAGWGLQFHPRQGTVDPIDGRYVDPETFLGEPTFDDYDTDQAALGYLFEHEFNETFTVRQNARYSYLWNEQRVFYPVGYDAASGQYTRGGGFSESEINNFAVDNQLQADFATGQFTHTMIGGLDYSWTDAEDLGISYSADPINPFDPVYGGPIIPGAAYQDSTVSQRQLGLYLQDQIRFGKLSLVLGGRHDWVESEFDNHLDGSTTDSSESAFTGKAALIYNFDNGIAPYVSYSESFLPLTTVITGSGDQYLAMPEEARQYEAGIKFQPVGYDALFTAAVFDITRDNVVRYGLASTTQVGQISSRGVELEAIASLNDNIDLRAAYTYIDAEITRDNDGGNEGNRPEIVPEHTASLWGNYTFRDGAFDGFGFGAGVRYVGESFGDEANTFTVDASTVFDAGISFERDSYELSLNVNNVFDEEYVASCFNENFGCFYGGGRQILGKATFRW